MRFCEFCGKKRCSKCHNWYDIDTGMFWRNACCADGYEDHCKVCKNAQRKKARQRARSRRAK